MARLGALGDRANWVRHEDGTDFAGVYDSDVASQPSPAVSESRLVYKDLARDGDVPACGAGGLWIRPGHDVAAEKPEALVQPDEGGMSVTPDDPMLMPQSRRPRSLGGTGRKPVWSMATSSLPQYSLRCRADRVDHALVEVAAVMTLGEFEATVCRTAHDWNLTHE